MWLKLIDGSYLNLSTIVGVTSGKDEHGRPICDLRRPSGDLHRLVGPNAQEIKSALSCMVAGPDSTIT